MKLNLFYLLFFIGIKNIAAQNNAVIEKFDCIYTKEKTLSYLHNPSIRDSVFQYLSESLRKNLSILLIEKDIPLAIINENKQFVTDNYSVPNEKTNNYKIYIKIVSGYNFHLSEPVISDSLKLFIQPNTLSFWFTIQIDDPKFKKITTNRIHYYINAKETSPYNLKCREYYIAPSEFLVICKHAFQSLINPPLNYTRVYRLNMKAAYYLDDRISALLNNKKTYSLNTISKLPYDKKNFEKTEIQINTVNQYFTSQTSTEYSNSEKLIQLKDTVNNYFRLAKPEYYLSNKKDYSDKKEILNAIKWHKQNSTGKQTYMLLKQDFRNILENTTYQIASVVAAPKENETYIHFIDGNVNFLLFNNDTIGRFKFNELKRIRSVDNILFDGINPHLAIKINEGNTLLEHEDYIKTTGTIFGKPFEINNLKNKKEIYINNKLSILVKGGQTPTSVMILNNDISKDFFTPLLFLIYYPIPVSIAPHAQFSDFEYGTTELLNEQFRNYDDMY